MYTPSHYKVVDPQAVRSFIKRHGFGALVSFKDSLHVTHLPFVVEEGEPLALSSHMARANPHWRAFAENPEALVIFQGPHAYISPALYEDRISVPTWNYAVVHAYGRVRLDDDVEAVLEKMIRAFDADYLAQWSELPEEYKSKLKAGIVGFELEVERVEAKFKMHQGKSRADRLRIIEEFGASGDTTLAGVAEYMRLSLSSEGET
ncbi:MAG TPA: FMN-binding negative transcriptional regulator [Pyrinomonadaceae bacterium]